MIRHHGADRPLAVAMLVLLAALALGACSGTTASVAPSAVPSAAPTAAPTAVVTPTPAPTPSPTPTDVSAAFLKIITDPAFSGKATLTGTMTIGDIKGDLSGIYAGDADSSESTLTIKAGTFAQTQDKVGTGGKNWTRVTPGPWLEDLPKGTPSKSFAETLRGVGAVVDLGVETHVGKQLHHLKPKAAGALTADQVGFDVGDATDAAFGMEFYATDDGTPASMILTGSWTQGTGTSAAKTTVEAEYVFTATGTPHTVAPPTDVWVRYTSKAHGYTMAHPADWTVKAAAFIDTYSVDGVPYVYVALGPYKGTTASLVATLKKNYTKDLGVGPTSEAPTRLGGQPAVRLTFDAKNDAGADVNLIDDITTRSGTGWEVYLISQTDPQNVVIFDQFVSTFAFTK